MGCGHTLPAEEKANHLGINLILPLFFRKMLIDSASYAVFSALANSLSNFQVAGVFYAGGRLMEQGKVDMVGIFR